MKDINKIVPLLVVIIAVILLVMKINKDNLSGKSPDEFFESSAIGKEIAKIDEELMFLPDVEVEKLFNGKTTILNVFASWCVACIAEHPVFKEFKHKRPDIQMIGVNWRDKELDAKLWLTNYGNPYDYVVKDQMGKYGIKLGIKGVPETFIIDEKGVVLAHMRGNISKDFLVNNVK